MKKTIQALLFLLIGIPNPDAGATILHVPGTYATIQSAINASSSGDTVLVDHGVYFENINFRGRNILLTSRYLLTRDPADIIATVINGSSPLHADTASCVLIISGETSAAVLEGFTLTKGKGTAWKDEHSAGIYREGGGILIALSSPTIRNNYIVDNDASDRSSTTSAGGGGIRAGDGNPTFLNNVIIRNKGRYGGGIVLNYSGATLKNNIVAQNTGGQDFGGAGIWINSNGPASKLIENNTIADNVTIGNDGGGLFIQSTSVTARNNIFWGNSANTGAQISVAPGASLSITYSDVQGGFAGSGNISSNPAFLDTSYYLSGSSPCIDTGNPSAIYNDPEDGAHIGFALFPSRGTLHNDMGAHGGPGSAVSVYVDLHQDDPMPPTSTTAYSDYQTPASVTLHWHDPALRNNGSQLTNFKIHIYRNTLLIAQIDSGIQTFIDTGLTKHQRYHYDINTIVPNDSSIFDSSNAYAGGNAQSQSPGNFSLQDASAGTILTWTNPSRQLDGTPLNDLAYILLYRDGSLIDSIAQSSADTAQQRTYLDTTSGYHSFRIRVRDNESPVNFSAMTDSILGYGKLFTAYHESFEQGAGSIYRTSGTWDTTSQLGYSGTHSITDSRSGNYSINSEAGFLLPTIILGKLPVLKYHDIAIVRPGSYAMIDVSINHRKNFLVVGFYDWSAHPLWSDAHADSGDWANEIIDLTPYAGDTATIRFRVITSGQPPADGWYIDSIFVGPADPVVTNSFSEDASWNMLSLPLSVPDSRIHLVYPDAISSAFSFQGKYISHDSLETGTGYWMKFDSAASVPITGAMIPRDTIDAASGWNMIGAISTEVDSSFIVTIPPDILRSSFYTYHGGYMSTRTLMPGKSYWIKTSQAGKIILSSFLVPGQQPSATAKRSAPVTLNTLNFTDSEGHQSELFFSERNSVPSEKYDLPPIPPAEGFDVRFASQTSLAQADDKGSREFPILLQSVQYPLTITWNIAKRMNGSALLIDGKEVAISANGSIRISNPDSRIVLRLPEAGTRSLPKEFALLQNYPNPFNPKTDFRFQIADISTIALKIYDVLGREVATLVQEELQPGTYTRSWDASSNASGVYYARMIVTGENGKQLFNDTRKLLLLR